jgi:hypothetical protein
MAPMAGYIKIPNMEVMLQESVNLFCSDEDSSSHLKEGDAVHRLQEFADLVSPLSTITKPRGMLVLSPSGLLHRISLHAIEIEGKPLIFRNPIVYCHSLSLLHQSFLQKQLTTSKSHSPPSEPVLFAAIDSARGQNFL